MAALLTPGLTPFQRQQVADVLAQIGAVPMGQMASLFVDVDVAAARALNIRRRSRRDCLAVAAELAGEHHINPLIIGFAYGLAIGVRQGRARSLRGRRRGRRPGSARSTDSCTRTIDAPPRSSSGSS